MFDVGFGEPDGAVVRMRVVGIGRMPAWGDGLSNSLASPAFAAAHGPGGAGTAHVRLVDDRQATRDAFVAGLAAAEAADPTVSVIADYVPPGPGFPTAETDPSVSTAERVLVAGLAVFGTVLALGGLLIVGQGLVRHHAARREAQWIERALGLTPAERVVARVLVGVLGAVLAGLVGAAVAVAAGVLEPLGSQARFEPAPGFRPPWAIAVAGGIGLAVLFVLLTAAAAALAGTSRSRRSRPSAAGRVDRAVARAGAGSADGLVGTAAGCPPSPPCSAPASPSPGSSPPRRSGPGSGGSSTRRLATGSRPTSW